MNGQYEEESVSQQGHDYFLHSNNLVNHSVEHHGNQHHHQKHQYRLDEGDMQQQLNLPPLLQYLSEVAPTAASSMKGNVNANTLPRLRLASTSLEPNVPIDPSLLAEEKPEDNYGTSTGTSSGALPNADAGNSRMAYYACDESLDDSKRTCQGNRQAPNSIDLTRTHTMTRGWDFEDPGLSTASTCASIEVNNLQTPLEVPSFLRNCDMDESDSQVDADGDGEFEGNLLKMESSEYPSFD